MLNSNSHQYIKHPGNFNKKKFLLYDTMHPIYHFPKEPILKHWQLLLKKLAANGEEITNAKTGNDILEIYW